MSKKKIHTLHFNIIERIASMTYTQIFTVWMSLALAFGTCYFLLSSFGDMRHGPAELVAIQDITSRFWNSIYFSVITSTTTGYGDIAPDGFSKVLASIQSILGWLLFGILVTKLVSRQQEMALIDVHRLTFEDVFHNVREGLFIIRKDFDHLIAKVELGKDLEEEDWSDLAVAYQQGQTMIAEIPDFYDNDNKLYMIDERREQLLHEGVQRTMHRINRMLDVFSEHGIPWAQNIKTLTELRTLIETIADITPKWQEQSPYNRKESFEDIAILRAAMNGRIANAVGM